MMEAEWWYEGKDDDNVRMIMMIKTMSNKGTLVLSGAVFFIVAHVMNRKWNDNE
jgi:hypothetical protein